MKIIAFLSRFTLICNIAFIFYVILWWVEVHTEVKGTKDALGTLPEWKQLIIALGYPAIFINIIMIMIYLVLFLSARKRFIPRRLAIINGIFLLLQFFFFFFK